MPGEEAWHDGGEAEYLVRSAAFMGLRLMSDQAAHLAKQGSTIPHLYPERQPSVLYIIPKPIGKAKFSAVILLYNSHEVRKPVGVSGMWDATGEVMQDAVKPQDWTWGCTCRGQYGTT